MRVSPLEDTIVAMRPVAVSLPWALPDKVRAIEPNMPLGALVDEPPGGFVDPNGDPVTVINHLVNFGWEYVWHCHILAHEEMDMMHSQAINVASPGGAPSERWYPVQVNNTATNTRSVFLVWTDNSNYESDWIIQRGNITGSNFTDFMKVPSYSTPQTGGTAMAIDNSFPVNTTPNYTYRVMASNVVGDDYVYAGYCRIPHPDAQFDTVRNEYLVSVDGTSHGNIHQPYTYGRICTPQCDILLHDHPGQNAGGTGTSGMGILHPTMGSRTRAMSMNYPVLTR